MTININASATKKQFPLPGTSPLPYPNVWLRHKKGIRRQKIDILELFLNRSSVLCLIRDKTRVAATGLFTGRTSV